MESKVSLLLDDIPLFFPLNDFELSKNVRWLLQRNLYVLPVFRNERFLPIERYKLEAVERFFDEANRFGPPVQAKFSRNPSHREINIGVFFLVLFPNLYQYKKDSLVERGEYDANFFFLPRVLSPLLLLLRRLYVHRPRKNDELCAYALSIEVLIKVDGFHFGCDTSV